MGVKTAEVLIREGLSLAGREYDAADTRPFSDLKDWLSSLALGWPWPHCSLSGTFVLAAGVKAIVLGGSSTNITGTRVTRVEFPLEIMYGPDILPDKIYQQAFNRDYDIFDTPVGLPDRASYSHDFFHTDGNVIIVFNKKPKTAIRIHIPYQFDPAAQYAIGDIATLIPWYPNDDTIKTSIAYYAAKHHDGVTSDKTLKFEDTLSIQVKNDKLKFGIIDSFVLKMNRSPRFR